MEIALYAHPPDIRALYDNGGLVRLRDIGITEVVMAVGGQAGRALVPWHPDGLVRHLEGGTVHYRPKGNYGLLQPKMSREVPASGPSPLERLCEEAAAVGMRVRAWTVLTHNARLGALHPDCCMQNAFGDVYPYALCPANPHVQQYMLATIRDLAAHRGLHTTELESFGWMGHRHDGDHDESCFPADIYSDLLLSLCFCASCTATMAGLRYESTPVGAAAVARWRLGVAVALRRHFAAADCIDWQPPRLAVGALLERLQSEFGPEFLTVLGHRIATLIGLATQLAPLRRAGCGLALQTHFDPLRDSAGVPVAALGGLFDEVALTTYGQGPDGVAAAMPHLLAARGAALEPPLSPQQWPRLRLCLQPRAPLYRSNDDLESVRALCASRDLASVAIHQFGLLPGRTLERVAAAFRD